MRKSSDFDQQNLIQFDKELFHPDRISPVSHRLCEHPLMKLDQLMQLARRLPRQQVRFHATTALPSSNFSQAERDHPHALPLDEALTHIETSGSWIALHNVQTDPLYRALLNEALDQVQDRIEGNDPGMFNRAFWIFIQSPGSVTPYHMDHEQNFLMQIQGKKRALVWNPEAALSAAALEAFHCRNSRELAVYSSDLDDVATAFDLEAGMGAYMPFTSPHLVKNADQVSITVSMTYCTKKTRFVETVHRCNGWLRKLGAHPGCVNPERLSDRLKFLAFDSLLKVRAKTQGKSLLVPYWSALPETQGH